ncbi:MAG: excinuclease ABC subunit UvrC [Oscillospiraceae bacterium]|nr:excinuclease ABC subunit UvrC [Oscillospiraceae bacterium]
MPAPVQQKNETLTLKLRTLPESPGCYLMRSQGKIIYVGKAINLKNRVRSYFQSSRGHSPKVAAMVAKIDDFDIMLCDTNLEALILECNLIKLHRPYYNIMLRDDKQYPYVRVDLAQDFPRLEIVRRVRQDGARYFGPFYGAGGIREVMQAANLIFPLRTCTRPMRPDKPTRPCLHHQLGRCLAPCAGQVSRAAYHAALQNAMDFLNGKYQGLLEEERAAMREASDARRYEQAAMILQRIQTIERLMQRQKAVSVAGEDQDVVAVAQDGLDAMVQTLVVRSGRMVGGDHYALERAGDAPVGEVIERFLTQFYQDGGAVPREILIQDLPEDADGLEAWLRALKGGAVSLHKPQRGQKRALVLMAEKNAQDALQKRNAHLQSQAERTTGAAQALADALGLTVPPRRIEGYDISNTQGALSVASMVVCIEGMASKKDYRHFRIKTVEGANDFASMHEVILRRFTHAAKEIAERDARGLPPDGGGFSELPDLVLVDGGPQQLAFAHRAMREAGYDIPMFGLAKKLEEIFLPGMEQPILLPRHSPALHLIQRLRDEAHRFAITHHRALRGKSATASELEAIPGVGPARRKALLKHFHNMAALRSASAEELAAAPGVSRDAAQAVYLHFLAQREG